MPLPRLFIDASFAPHRMLPLGEAQARYLSAVLRLKPGAALRVFNGVDGEWAGTVAPQGRKGLAVLLDAAAARPQARVDDLLLLFSPVKRQRTDLIVEKAVELGVRTLQPVMVRRTVAETVRAERMTAIAVEAAEQTGRLDVATVREAAPLARVLEAWDGRRLLFADEGGDAAAIPAALAGLPAPRLAVLIGPEGGFDPEERRMLRALPYVTPVTLGPRILRAETAAIAALALVGAHWRPAPDPEGGD